MPRPHGQCLLAQARLRLRLSTQRAGALRCGMTGSPRDRRSARLRQCHVKARRGMPRPHGQCLLAQARLRLRLSTQRAGALRCGMTGSPRDRRSARLRQCHVKARRGAACRAPTGNDGTCGVSSWRRRTRLATALGRPVPIRGYIRAYRSVTPLLLRLPKRQTRVRATSTPALPPGAPAAPCPASL
jgi:hypothetical protein